MAGLYSNTWIWIIALGILFILIAGIGLIITRKADLWIWILFALGIILVIAGIIIDLTSHKEPVNLLPGTTANPLPVGAIPIGPGPRPVSGNPVIIEVPGSRPITASTV
jgi:hypothetical protein